MAEQFIDVKNCENCDVLLSRGAMPRTQSTGLPSDADFTESRPMSYNETENELDQSFKVQRLFDEYVKELLVEVPTIVTKCIKSDHRSAMLTDGKKFSDWKEGMRLSHETSN